MPPKGSKSKEYAAEKPKTNENIFLFVPNLIGYTRIILAGISLTYMSYHPKYCTVAYVISCLLDAVDGQAARALGQSSRFGAVLDMVTDRCTTSCLQCFLSSAYPSWAILFQSLIALDFSSHYIHMYSSLVAGSESHKRVTKKQSRILYSYYHNTYTLFFFCAGNELFFVCLYLMHFYKVPIGIPLAQLMSNLPLSVRTAILEVVPFKFLTAIELLTWPQLAGILTFPICFLKNVINVVQFWKASRQLCDLDLEERYVKQQQKKQ